MCAAFLPSCFFFMILESKPKLWSMHSVVRCKLGVKGGRAEITKYECENQIKERKKSAKGFWSNARENEWYICEHVCDGACSDSNRARHGLFFLSIALFG